MIFVTVGTAYFDPLVEAVDRLVGLGEIQEPVVAQIGRGLYEPKNIRFFRFMKNLQKAYTLADLIVSTGGAGTTMECVTKGLRLVVVENESLAEGHQAQLIGEMERRGHLIWCRNLNALKNSIDIAYEHGFVPFKTDPPQIHKIIKQLIDTTC